MSKSSPRKASSLISSKAQQLLQNPVMSVGYLISAIVLLVSGHSYLALMFFVGFVLSNPVIIWKAQHHYRDALRQYRLSSVMLTGVIFGLFSGIILGLAFVEPSHAQFFNNAQNFIQGTFTKGSGLSNSAASGIIGLVMNTLRLLFVMYVLFGIVQVFNAVRQGEEWKDLAKTPFFVVLAGTLGDVLVGAIVGPTT